MPTITTHRLQILGAALLFSSGGAAIKATSLSAWQVACFRSAIAAITLVVVLPGSRRFWRPRTLLVGAAFAATMVLFVGGNKLTTAANTIFLQSTAPMYLLFFGPWLLKEPVRRTDLIFTACLVLGLVLFFVGVEPPRSSAPDPFAGNLLGMAAGLTWALTLVGLRWMARHGADRAAASVLAGNLIACAVCLPWAFPLLEIERADWILIPYLGVFQIGLAYVLMTRGVRGVSALEASLLILVEPVLSALWAWSIHGERPGGWSLTGAGVILISTLLFTMRIRRARAC